MAAGGERPCTVVYHNGWKPRSGSRHSGCAGPAPARALRQPTRKDLVGQLVRSPLELQHARLAQLGVCGWGVHGGCGDWSIKCRRPGEGRQCMLRANARPSAATSRHRPAAAGRCCRRPRRSPTTAPPTSPPTTAPPPCPPTTVSPTCPPTTAPCLPTNRSPPDQPPPPASPPMLSGT
jgi:hypothetical protein